MWKVNIKYGKGACYVPNIVTEVLKKTRCCMGRGTLLQWTIIQHSRHGIKLLSSRLTEVPVFKSLLYLRDRLVVDVDRVRVLREQCDDQELRIAREVCDKARDPVRVDRFQ